jgi:hypothetical protein
MQLADNDALGTVDDEGALGSHEWQLAHEDFLFFGSLLFLQQKGDIQRRSVREPLTQAFQPVDLRLPDLVGVKVQYALPVIALNRENLGKNGLQTEVTPLGGRDLRLQKLLVRVGLQLDKVRRSNDFFNSAEVNSLYGSRWHLLFQILAGSRRAVD